MTNVYFLRYAELTSKGLNDRIFVTDYLSDKSIDVVFSSTYIRTIDTVKDFAERNGLLTNAGNGENMTFPWVLSKAAVVLL
ncbi:MAG: hypothetical protein ACK5LV_09570 [Lachnospirales bacterium]